MAAVHLEDSGDKVVNSYQGRLGLLFGSVGLIILLVSSSGQSAVSYTQFAYAVSQTTQKCPSFPTPITLMAQLFNGSATLFSNSSSSSKWYINRVYIKSFQLSGLDVNSTNIFFGILSMKILATSESFYNSSGIYTKGSSTNNSYTFFIYKFKFIIVTQKEGG
mgnify:CR=1 FL=1